MVHLEKKLKPICRQVAGVHLRELFARDPGRFQRFSLRHGGILFDYSKNWLDEDTLVALCDLAREANLASWRERMFRGGKINISERRAVLHTALRSPPDEDVCVDGENLMPTVHAELDRMATFAEIVRKEVWRGYTGKPIRQIVNIGIGGSDLGPKLVCEALRYLWPKHLKLYFVSNIDSTHLEETLDKLDAETTLFVIASKTFTTLETMVNANSARSWLVRQIGNDTAVEKHFVAVSANEAGVTAFGIDKSHMFQLWDWVGGRYSLWSAIGLPIMLAIGAEGFKQLLAGARSMDEHFCEAPFEHNMPIILALLGILYINGFGARAQAVLPYDHGLRSLPAYLQQLEMESNGKCVDRDGLQVNYSTVPIIWGMTGINGQHTFYQFLHQGTQLVPVDFILAGMNEDLFSNHRDILASSCFAQAEALMRGRTHEETYAEIEVSGKDVSDQALIDQMSFAGNRPSNTLLLDTLTAENLGALIALYEHKVFVQGVIWSLNSFDQWGVELGKQLTKPILAELQSGKLNEAHDASTKGLIEHFLELREQWKKQIS